MAPMADVTHVAFRRIMAKYGRPDCQWTEFVNVTGLCHEEAHKALLVDLLHTPEEGPVVAQIFG